MNLSASLLSLLRDAVLARPGFYIDYFIDRSDKTIFSIATSDYYKLEEGVELLVDPQTGYTKEETDFIIRKISKISRGSNSIVALPTFSLKEVNAMIHDFINRKSDHTELKAIKAAAVAFDTNLRLTLKGLMDPVQDDFLKQEWTGLLNTKADEKIQLFIRKSAHDLALYKVIVFADREIVEDLYYNNIPDQKNTSGIVDRAANIFFLAIGIGIVLFILLVLLVVLGIKNGFVPP